MRGNLLCVTYTSARGKVFLFDLEDRRPLSHWELPAPDNGWSDAGGVVIDRDFTLYVADASNHKVLHYTAFGRHLGDLGRPSDDAVGKRRDRPGLLHHPHAVAVGEDFVLVACGDRRMRRGVQCFSRDGRVLRPLPPFGDPEAQFGAPRGLWIDEQEILVADTLNGCVQRFRHDGVYVASVPTGGAPDEASRPVSVLRLVDGDLLVIDHGDRWCVERFAVSGREHGEPEAMAESVHRPVALARDEQGRVYVLDQDGERVQRFHPDLRPDTVLVDLAEILDDFPAR